MRQGEIEIRFREIEKRLKFIEDNLLEIKNSRDVSTRKDENVNKKPGAAHPELSHNTKQEVKDDKDAS